MQAGNNDRERVGVALDLHNRMNKTETNRRQMMTQALVVLELEVWLGEPVTYLHTTGRRLSTTGNTSIGSYIPTLSLACETVHRSVLCEDADFNVQLTRCKCCVDGTGRLPMVTP